MIVGGKETFGLFGMALKDSVVRLGLPGGLLKQWRQGCRSVIAGSVTVCVGGGNVMNRAVIGRQRMREVVILGRGTRGRTLRGW
jgi:hypothetical protein